MTRLAPAMEAKRESLVQDAVNIVIGHRRHTGNNTYVCHFSGRINSSGIWYGDDPLAFSAPLLMVQLSLISIITRAIYFLLKPFGQPMIVSQILGGLILGPSVLGRNPAFSAKVFPTMGKTVLDTFSVFGFMLFLFLIGVKMDLSMALKSGKRALVIGILGFVFPYALAGFVAFLLRHFVTMDNDISRALPFVVALLSVTAFPVIACFLAELKILNSEIGRLAASSSIICDICSWSIMSLRFAAKVAMVQPLTSSIGSILSSALLIAFIVFGIRPAALWAIRHTPEGKPVKEVYIFALFVALMGCGFLGEAIGIHGIFASFILGLVIPDGPPLGAALVERLDCFVSGLLMPIFFTICGLRTDVFAIQNLKNVLIVLFIVFIAFLGKIIGTILPPLYCRIPFRDALSLALVMNSKGIVEIAALVGWKDDHTLDDQCFTLLVISVVAITGVISPLVRSLYDPSRRYLAYRRRTILHAKRDAELRILACIHSRDNVRAILNILEASNPTKESPINVYILHLVELVGRATSLLVAHRLREKPSPNPTQSERIFNVFRHYEQNNNGFVTVQCFTGVSPQATMHNDVCSLALEKRTCLIIIPFHKQWVAEGRVESSHVLRNLNCNVVEKAPCSVGILVDRGHLRNSRAVLESSSLYHVAVLFFGGADDREALAYGGRMAEHPNIRLTVFRFSASTDILGGSTASRTLDNGILNDFRLNTGRNERVVYQEEVVTDETGMLNVIQYMENAYNLVMVGRRHEESQFMSRLSGWSDCPELGAVGDVLAAPDFKGGVSVLVVQQQARVWGMLDPEHSTHLKT
ncbi:hypothetical protein HHK36_016087 [Tetracentron sinense]|uniref:Cation/H+ exchanger domain-containing protein n=1 Tax=Tetracentron sinense TaxID=13715 RepID=A0A834Z059_TETSI|nr:hypothetical protein HHK36_016087 [Tetracentron sinense]